MAENIKWKVQWDLYKWHREKDWADGLPPDEVICIPDNMLMAAGITELLKVLTGLGGTPFSSGNAYIYVGDGTTAEASGQVDLQGTNKASAPMDVGYPNINGQSAVWSGTFGSSAANFSWQEVGVLNGPSPPGGAVVLLNRRVEFLTTKLSGSVISLRCSVSLS